jgi:hypothetical protein
MDNVQSNIQESSQDILNDIQSLQKTEQGLFNNLENNPNLTSEQQQDILDKINQITTMRINLYKALSEINGYYKDSLKSSSGTLKDQSIAVDIVEKELNQMKQNLKTLKQVKNDKMRLVEINTYYGEKYEEHAKLMKIIIFTFVPIIIISILYKAELLPKIIYYILLLIIAVIGSYFFWIRMASIISRDAMDYNEYDWYFDPSSAPSKSTTIDNQNDPWLETNLGTCIGEACCSEGQQYDSTLNVCVGDSTVNTTQPTIDQFITHTLTKKATTNKYNNDNIPKPSNSNSFITYSNFR